jgi:hypothetical protein
MRVIDPTVEWTADAVGLVQLTYLLNFIALIVPIQVAWRQFCPFFMAISSPDSSLKIDFRSHFSKP